MSVPNSVEELLQLIRKSGMIDDQRLTAYVQRRQLGRGLPDDPREFSDEMIRDGMLTYFQAEQYLLGKWRGFSIGKYKLLERVGVGGMGQVFLCEHMFMKKHVAVKVLPPAKAEQPAALGRFYREARAAGGLQHPNVVRTHDIDQDGNLHFIVMEYVDGTNLLDVVKKFGPMDVRRATSYVRQAAAGLDYAFRNGIIHRDVKPGNILIDRSGTARLLDMGLARFFADHSDQLTVKYDDKIVLGTADYVAPEQVANSHAVDVRADVYGLGATFYFLLAGHPPFPTGTVSQKLLWHRTKEPTPIRQVRPEIPEGLAAVVEKMMAKDPKARFQTPAQVYAELGLWLTGEVPPPAEEEMPQLSPAATALLAATAPEGDPAEAEPPPSQSAKAVHAALGGKPGGRPGPGGTAVADPRPAAGGNPFGPQAGQGDPFAATQSQKPLGGRGSVPPAFRTTAEVLGQSAVETVAGPATQTPAPAPFLPANPFTGGDLLTAPPPVAPTRWPAVAAAAVAVAVLAVGAAAWKWTRPQPANPPAHVGN